MKNIIVIVIICSLAGSLFSQNTGIGVSTPSQKLDVPGWIKVGNESAGTTGTTGTFRYHSSGKLQFYNGSAWVDISGSRTMYTAWGLSTCPTGTLVYTGYAGSGAYNHSGSGANTLCLTTSPSWSGATFNDADHNGALVYGLEFETSGYGISTLTGLHNREARCAVCEVAGAGEMIMIPGTTVCPSGWTRQYWGYIMATYYDGQQRSEFVCVYNTPTVYGSTTNSNGALWYPTETELCALTAPYVQNRELPCSVCTR